MEERRGPIEEVHTFPGTSAGNGLQRMHGWLVDLMVSEEGATAAEYAVLIALIAAAIFVGAALLGVSVDTRLNDMGTDLSSL